MPKKKLAPLEQIINVLQENNLDWLAEAIRFFAQLLMDAEVTQITKAEHGERTENRENQRNGYRLRRWITRVGEIMLRIPKLRSGSYFPSFLEFRRRAEKALAAALGEAYLQGISTRRMEMVCKELGIPRLDRNAVSRMVKALNEEVESFRNRRLEHPFPYLILDARYEMVRHNGHVVKKAVLIAVGVRVDGHREVLGLAIGASESEASWKAFLEGLVERGLHGVMLVISDAHKGLQKAIEQTMLGASWQWCRVHFMRAILGRLPKREQPPIAAMIKMIFAQTSLEAARAKLHEMVSFFENGRYVELARCLESAEPNILAYMSFPEAHWEKLHSTNMIERLMRTIKARTRVVSIFPDDDSLIRLVGAILVEENEEWLEARRYISEQSMLVLLNSKAAPASLSAGRRMIPNNGMAA